jgi:hypothetical protein
MLDNGQGGMYFSQFLVYGKTWQRAGLIIALIAGGVLLAVSGVLLGILPAVLGTAIGVRMWGPDRVRAARFRHHKRETR